MPTNLPDAIEQMLQKLAQQSSQTITLLMGDQVLAEIEPIEPNIPENWVQREDGAIGLPTLPGWHFFNWAGYDGYKEKMTLYSDLHNFNVNRLFVMNLIGDSEGMLQATTFDTVDRNGFTRRVVADPIEETWVYGVAVKTEEDVQRVFRSRFPRR